MKRVFMAFALLAFVAAQAAAQERGVELPPPLYDPPPTSDGIQKLVVAGGCFWGVQGVFQHVTGVTRAVSGYAGGMEKTAHYDLVSRGDTGHAESVEITYDPRHVTLGKLLQVYFSVSHDPTQTNRQGPDEGTQYRSTIFTSSPEQEKVARQYILQLSGEKVFDAPIVTKIEPLSRFYPAEAYHQDYMIKHPRAPYIVQNDAPKIENLKRLFTDLYRETPAVTGP